MIRFIGDSHVSVFGGKDYMQPTWPNDIDSGADKTSIRQNLIAGIEQYRLGPQTAFNILKTLELVKNILDTSSKEDDFIFFSAGEIDLREHIIRVAEKNSISIQESVRNTVNNYIGFLENIQGLGFKVGVLGPHLALWDFSDYKKLEAANLLNNLLKDWCNDNGQLYIGALDFITDASFYFDGLHLSQKCIPFFIDQLKNINIYE